MNEHQLHTDKNNYDEKFKCTGCRTTLTRDDEYCPNCERLNPHYKYR